jgi:hypothetical protein
LISLILLVFAFVLALCEAFFLSWEAKPWPRPHLGWLALALYFLYLLLGPGAIGLR